MDACQIRINEVLFDAVNRHERTVIQFAQHRGAEWVTGIDILIRLPNKMIEQMPKTEAIGILFSLMKMLCF